MKKDFSKCNYCGLCGECMEMCAGDEECSENCADVCPNGALIKEKE